MTRRRWFDTVIGVLLTALMMFPIYWMINVSLTPRQELRAGRFFPANPTLANFGVVLDQQMSYLLTSVVVGIGTVLLTIVVAAPASYALGQLQPPGRRGLSFALIVAQMVPAVVMSLGFYSLYNQWGLLNTIPGLILADTTIAVPFAAMLLTAFMASLPRELSEAATLDGASYWRTFRSVVLPLSRNSLITVALFSFLWAWSDFIFASTLNREGGSLRPITMGIYNYIGAQNQEWGPIMATAVVASIPTALLLIVAQRYVAAGVTAGAVKS